MAERRFHELLDAAPDGILQVDASGHIVLVNRALENIFGYTREELLGKPVEILIPREQRIAHESHRAGYREHPSTRAMGAATALEGLRKDGSRFPVEISLSPSPSGDVDFFATAIIRDVTERKRNEAAFRAEQEMKTLELERANRLKSEFLASMSHELRTPLHTIIGFSELLAEELQGPLNDKQQRFISHIRKDSAHLLALINDVLDLSKIEAGRMELHPEVFDLPAVIDESLATVKTVVTEKDLHVTTTIAQLVPVEADKVRIKQRSEEHTSELQSH